MSGFSHEELGEAFELASGLSGPHRSGYLDELSSRKPALAAEVRALLSYHLHDEEIETGSVGDAGRECGTAGSGAGGSGSGRSSSFLDGPAIRLGSAGEDDATLTPGTLLCEPGAHAWTYRILRELGRGSMGVVYHAQQNLPARRVALKVLRAHAGSHAARRLAHEAEALGALHHRGVAQVYAAGPLVVCGESGGAWTSAGPPRLAIAMELIEGPTLGQWARDRSLREKVEVVAELADAVEHAHQRGVVHRDLKPGNVLIDGTTITASSPPRVPQPKVLDFGVARLAPRDAAAQQATLTVTPGSVIGTLRYMSPEQATADNPALIDGRSDVYALGAILYDLLTGTPPVPVDDTTIAGAVHRINTVRPSPLEGLSLPRRAAADLQTVIDKSLEKDPARRYPHALDLAADLRRVLGDEPIAARPPTAGEQLARLIRRNKTATTALAAGLGLLIAGGGIAAWQALRATREAERARQQTGIAAGSLAFMERMIFAATPEQTRGLDVTVREMLTSAVAHAATMPDDRATASALRFLASALTELGEYHQADPLAQRAVRISTALDGPDADETVEAVCTAHDVAVRLGREAQVLPAARELHRRALERYGPDHPLRLRTYLSLSFALNGSDPDQAAEGEAILRDILARTRRLYSESDDRLHVALNDLAAHLLTSHKYAEGITLSKKVYELRVKHIGADHPSTIVSMGNLTGAYMANGDIEKATEISRRAVPLAERVLGHDHPTTLFARQYSVQLAMMRGEVAGTEPLANALWKARVRRHGPDHRLTMCARGIYVTAVLVQRRMDEAEPLVRAFVADSERLFGPKDDDTVSAITLLYDLEEARNNLPGMEAAAARLQGTRFEQAVNQQMEAHRKASKPPRANDP